jgi:hypothetical protein
MYRISCNNSFWVRLYVYCKVFFLSALGVHLICAVICFFYIGTRPVIIYKVSHQWKHLHECKIQMEGNKRHFMSVLIKTSFLLRVFREQLSFLSQYSFIILFINRNEANKGIIIILSVHDSHVWKIQIIQLSVIIVYSSRIFPYISL